MKTFLKVVVAGGVPAMALGGVWAAEGVADKVPVATMPSTVPATALATLPDAVMPGTTAVRYWWRQW